jgi:hypothetical protein
LIRVRRDDATARHSLEDGSAAAFVLAPLGARHAQELRSAEVRGGDLGAEVAVVDHRPGDGGA